MKRSDHDLLHAIRTSTDRAAYAELYRRHVDAARAAAYRIAPKLDQDDVVSESFTRILQALENGAGPGESFRPYLYQTVRRVSIDFSVAAGGEVPVDGVELPDPDSLHDIADVIGDQTAVAQTLAALPERWQAVLWYTEVEGFAPREAARLLGLSANNVSQIRRRARNRFRDLFVNQEPVLTDSRFGRTIALVVLGGSTAPLLFPIFDSATASPAEAAPQSGEAKAPGLSKVSVKHLSLIGGALVVLALGGAAWLMWPVREPSSPVPRPTVESSNTDASDSGQLDGNDQTGDRTDEGVNGTESSSQDDQRPDDWETIAPSEPVVRGPSD